MPEPSPLGAFLRSRRELLTPDEVGLAPSPRRRTPGLRREELAMLASISVDYLVRLEQGRERSPSSGVLAALSDALRLDADERRHLGSMVASTTQTEMCPPPADPSPLAPTTLAVLERLEPTPAAVVEASTDLVAWNGAYEALMGPTGLLDHDPPNLLRYTFAEPAARALYLDWDAVAADLVSGLRAATTGCAVARSVEALIGELSLHSPEFVRLWARHEVRDRRRGVERLSHPVGGAMELAFEALVVADPRSRVLVTHLPVDAASAAALERVIRTDEASGTGGLRVLQGGAA